MVEPTFEAIVRGYKALEADPDLAAVIVEVEPGTAIPAPPGRPDPGASGRGDLTRGRVPSETQGRTATG